jgi:hypothetical protein
MNLSDRPNQTLERSQHFGVSVGVYASHLSDADIAEIKIVAANYCARHQILALGPPSHLTVNRPGYVNVDVPITGRYDVDGLPSGPQVLTTIFNVKKRRGHRLVDDFGSGSH